MRKTADIAFAIIFLGLSFLCSLECSAQRRWDSPSSADSSDAGQVLQDLRLRAGGKASKHWLGIAVKDTSDESGRQVVKAETVVAGSPAEKAGIQGGDVIIQIAEEAVPDCKALIRIVSSFKVGVDYPITILRNGRQINLTIRPELQPTDRLRFASSSRASQEISDNPAPRKGPRDINVLKYAFVDPKSHVVTFVGKYDHAYNTGPIPYEDYLRVALQNPYPSFSLDPSKETLGYLKEAIKIVDADLARMDDPVFADQWAQKVANLLLKSESLLEDNRRFFKHCSEALGVTGDELKRMYDAATGKIDIPATEFMGLAAKMVRGIGLNEAGNALGVLAAGGAPEEMLYNMADKLGLSSQYKELAMRGLAPEEFRKEEIILCISQLCRHFEAPENEIQNKVAAIRSGESADLIIDYMGKKLSDYITNKSGRRMIDGMVLGPGVMAELYGLPVPKAELVFRNLPSDSLLGDVFFKSDYRLKTICAFPDAKEKVQAHQTQHEFIQREATDSINKKLCNADFTAGNRLVPGEVAMRVSPSGDVVEFGQSKMKVLGWIIKMHGKADREATDFIDASLSKYADYLTENYDEYARVYPEWHKLTEAAKIIALARWAKNNGYKLEIVHDATIKVTQPKVIDGFWSAVFSVGNNSQYLTFIAEGGASFAEDEGEHWLKTKKDVTFTSDVSKQLAASAIFAEQALTAALSGNPESARELAEKSAQAMTGEIDLARLPSLDSVPLPNDCASYAAVTATAIDQAAACLDQMNSAAKDLQRAQELADTSRDESEKLKQEATKVQEDAQKKLDQILVQVRNYKSDPSRAGDALLDLRGESATVALTAANLPPTAGGSGTQGITGTTTDATAKPQDLSKIIHELDDVNKQIAYTREALLKLNASIQADRKLFVEWENSASEGIDRCVSIIGDIALDIGVGGLAKRQDTLYELAKKLPGKPEDVIEKYRYLASLTQRLKEAKAVNDLSGLAAKENKTESELWETVRDGINQLSGLFSLDETSPGKWWKYGILAADSAYNLTELRLTWENMKTLESNNEKYAEAVRKLSARMKDLIERQKEIKKKIDAGGQPEYISK